MGYFFTLKECNMLPHRRVVILTDVSHKWADTKVRGDPHLCEVRSVRSVKLQHCQNGRIKDVS